jgi:putative ABC transport system permease protein
MQAATGLGLQTSGIYTYLANSIRTKDREIPYSAITAADLGAGALASIQTVAAPSVPSPPMTHNESIWLTDWALRDLRVVKGEPVEVEYYSWLEDGKMVTRSSSFRVAGVVAISGEVNSLLSPEIPGITEARSLHDWDPPFPLDLGRIRKEDEDFWDRHRATPKAFISLSKGQELWQSRFGKLTALRVMIPNPANMESSQANFAKALLDRLSAQQVGFAATPIKELGLAASHGATDFGEYFLYFSFFLIVAAILLAVLFFKLMIEQRVREVGLLKAAGYPSGKIRAIFLWEGLILSGAGGLLGLLGSLVYGWFMVFGLRTFWIGAVGTRNLGLHISKLDLLIGIFAGVLCTFCAILWTLRDLQKNTPRLLLTGVFESHAVQFKRSRSLRIIVVLSFGAALLLAACSALGIISQLAGFFGSGFALLLFLLCSTALYLRKKRQFPVAGQGMPAFFRLGMRNVISRPARSLLCACLIASATFIILSMEAFRKDPQNTSLEKSSGTGGYPYIGESDLAIVHDLNSNAGREAAGIPATEFPELQNISFISFRERPGDDASCLNLYAPQNPRILGAPASFLAEARFSFQDSLASTPQEKANPWLLLKSSPQASVIPAIADANTIQYTLHLSLGDEITVDGGKRGRIRLRLVAALKDSLLQGMLIISENNFLRAFPEIEGRRFFLLDAPKPLSASGIRQLKERMVDWGFQVESSQERLAAFHRVENTYLTTFQSLGTLGLVLGVVGLAAILLRNVLERRKELALLRAIGYRKLILVWIILFESLALIVWGLAAGALSAFLAVLPALFSRGVAFPFMTTALILMAVLASGILSSLFAVIAVYRSPLLATLRSE